MRRALRVSLAAVMLALTGPLLATAQQALVQPQRDCQTITTCNFKKGGSYRGCLSSYSCRVCKLVSARCSIPGSSPSQRVCREMRCTWGA